MTVERRPTQRNTVGRMTAFSLVTDSPESVLLIAPKTESRATEERGTAGFSKGLILPAEPSRRSIAVPRALNRLIHSLPFDSDDASHATENEGYRHREHRYSYKGNHCKQHFRQEEPCRPVLPQVLGKLIVPPLRLRPDRWPVVPSPHMKSLSLSGLRRPPRLWLARGIRIAS